MSDSGEVMRFTRDAVVLLHDGEIHFAPSERSGETQSLHDLLYEHLEWQEMGGAGEGKLLQGTYRVSFERLDGPGTALTHARENGTRTWSYLLRMMDTEDADERKKLNRRHALGEPLEEEVTA